MRKIALISDTHGFFDENILPLLEPCDEIWHAGDIGSMQIPERLQKLKPFRAVYGNIDDATIRNAFPEDLFFECEGVAVFMTHIGGYPNRYNRRAEKLIQTHQPKLFICGHSHILKVIYDKQYQLLHINPGACGNEGFHSMKTMVRFSLHEGRIQDAEVIELGKRGS